MRRAQPFVFLAMMFVGVVVCGPRVDAKRTPPAPAFIELNKCEVYPNPCLEWDAIICGPIKVNDNWQLWDEVIIDWVEEKFDIVEGTWQWFPYDSGTIAVHSGLPYTIGDPFVCRVYAPAWPQSSGPGPFMSRFTFYLAWRNSGGSWHFSDDVVKYFTVYRAN